MPMPPPRASTSGRRDRQSFHEMGQIMRAVEREGPLSAEELQRLVGADYWEAERFERALSYLLTDGLVLRNGEGLLEVTP